MLLSEITLGSAFVSLAFLRKLFLKLRGSALVVFKEGFAQVRHKLAIVEYLTNFHRSEYLFAALTLLTLHSYLDELSRQLKFV